MEKVMKTSMKRKRPDGEPRRVVTKTAKTSVADIQTNKESVVADHGNVPATEAMWSQCSLQRNYLRNIQSRTNVKQIVIQGSSEKLQADIERRESEMMNIQEMMDFHNQIESDLHKKLEYLKSFKTEMANNSSISAFIKQKRKNIDKLRHNIIVGKLEATASFQREVECLNGKLSKINKSIDLTLRKRDKTAFQKSVLFEAEAKLAVWLSHLQNALQQEQDDNELMGCDEEADVRILGELKNRIEQLKQSMSDNVVIHQKIKQQQATVEEQQNNANIALDNVIESNKMLNAQLNEQENEENHWKKLCDRIHEANKKMLNKKEQEYSKFEFDQERLSLLNVEETLVAKVAELQMTVDKRVNQYNELKRLKLQINEKQQHYAEVVSNSTPVMMRTSSKFNYISAAQKFIDEMNSKLVKDNVVDVSRISTTASVEFEGLSSDEDTTDTKVLNVKLSK